MWRHALGAINDIGVKLTNRARKSNKVIHIEQKAYEFRVKGYDKF